MRCCCLRPPAERPAAGYALSGFAQAHRALMIIAGAQLPLIAQKESGMQRRISSHFILIIVAMLLMIQTSNAQTQTTSVPVQAEHEQILKDMLNEIHQLRVA